MELTKKYGVIYLLLIGQHKKAFYVLRCLTNGKGEFTMAKNILNSILNIALKTAGGTAKKKTTTAAAPKATGSSAQTKSAADVAKNLSPGMKAAADKVWNKPISTPKGWTRTTDTSYSST